MERRVPAVAVLALLAGCRHGAEARVTDTESRSFSVTCDKDGTCAVAQKSGVAAPSGKPAVVLSSPGTLVGVCNVATPGAKPAAEDCRPVTCKADTDCPPAHGLPKGACLDGWCIEPTHKAITVEDAVMLCLAGTGLGRESPKQIERYALAENCGSPCRVPEPCRQP